ncbi:MAG: hypothetical protein GX488_06885 [Clostridiales bacterium]|nr:hypothetical protein [Clostridiales bacterium]
MRKKSLKLCGFSCIMGIFGAFLRWLQIQNIFEPDTGLATPNSPWSWAFIAFVILSASMLIVFVRSFRKSSFPLTYPEIYSGGKFYKTAAIIIGALMALGGFATIIRTLSSRSVFDLLLGIFSFAGAVSSSSFVISAKKSGSKNAGIAVSVIIVLFLCFWLISAYKFSASDPVIWHFAPRILAISSSVLAFYYVAGFVFGRPKPLLALYFCQLGAFLSITTLADSYPLGEQFIVLSFAAFMELLSFLQVCNIISGEPSEGD